MGLIMLSNALPPAGFYLYCRLRKVFPIKARTDLINASIDMPIGIIGGYLLQTIIFS